MPRGPEPSWEIKVATLDLAVKQGQKPEVIRRELDRFVFDLQEKTGLTEIPPDERTISKILREFQEWPEERVALLPPHIWRLRGDWEEIRHRLEKLAGAREGLGAAKSEEDQEDQAGITKRVMGELYTPAPEAILIGDLGSLGIYSTRLTQNIQNVILEDLSYTPGIKATITAVDREAAKPRATEISWEVLSSGSLERYCPVEADPLFSCLVATLPNAVKEDFASWKRLGGSYLEGCSRTRLKIHRSAKTRTAAAVGEQLIRFLPRLSHPPPEPLTVNFGDLVYQLGIEYGRSSGAKGLPDESWYHTRPSNTPFLDELVFGSAEIHVATTLPGLAQPWAVLHRKMIEEWGRSPEIGMLLRLFKQLRDIEQTIGRELETATSR